MADEAREELVKRAKTGLQKNVAAGFDDQVPYLRELLAHLPIQPNGAPIIEAFSRIGVPIRDMDSVLTNLANGWACNQPSDSHDGAVTLKVGAEMDKLVLEFELCLWSKITSIRCVTIIRVSEITYLYWDRQPPQE